MAAIRRQYTEVFVGLFVFFGLAIMGVLILQFGRFQDKLRNHYPLKVEFPDASGIRKGVPVRLGGADIGYVENEPVLKDDFSGLLLDLKIYNDRKIPRDSKFTVGTNGLMGDTYVKVVLPEKHTGKYYDSGELIKGTTGGGLDVLQGSAEDLLQKVNGAIEDVQKTVSSLDTVFHKIENGVLDDENIKNIRVMLAELKESSENINNVSKKLDPLVVDAGETIKEAKSAVSKMDGTFASAKKTFDEATEAVQSIKSTVAKAEPALENLDPTLSELRAVLKNANRAIGKIENGEGVAAALISDSGLREDLESFVDKLDRHGVLFYPRDKKEKGKIFRARPTEAVAQDRPALPRPGTNTEAAATKRNKPFQWLKVSAKPKQNSTK